MKATLTIKGITAEVPLEKVRAEELRPGELAFGSIFTNGRMTEGFFVRVGKHLRRGSHGGPLCIETQQSCDGAGCRLMKDNLVLRLKQ
jgi:hypothetical protein